VIEVRWEYYASNFLGCVQLASITILRKRTSNTVLTTVR
jgi:hypothetical protein